jgi:hypothetical protein
MSLSRMLSFGGHFEQVRFAAFCEVCGKDTYWAFEETGCLIEARAATFEGDPKAWCSSRLRCETCGAFREP